MNAERTRRPDLMTGVLLMAALKDAAVVIASLLADPFDRDARTEARTWLTTWMAADDAATTKGGAL